MKRTERRHLKENELEKWVREAREMFEAVREQASWALVLVAVVAVGVVGYLWWRQHVQTNAGCCGQVQGGCRRVSVNRHGPLRPLSAGRVDDGGRQPRRRREDLPAGHRSGSQQPLRADGASGCRRGAGPS